MVKRWPNTNGNYFRCDHSFNTWVTACPEGCHDDIPYEIGWGETDNPALPLIVGMLEYWANKGELDAFHARYNEYGQDGLDEDWANWAMFERGTGNESV